VRGEDFEQAPYEAVWGDGEASVLIVFTVVQDRRDAAPVVLVRSQMRRVVTTLRLFEPGSYALGPSAWMRIDAGSWRPLALPFTGNAGPPRVIAASEEDELRGFFNLISRRAMASAPLAWSLARFEMGTERASPLESLTDYLLAARALLEPEGPAASRLASRLAAICASPAERLQVSESIERALVLERLAITAGPQLGPETEAAVSELREHVRALLRDMLCGHLDGDVRALADELLAPATAEGGGPGSALPRPGDSALPRPSGDPLGEPTPPPERDPSAEPGPVGETRLGLDEVGLGMDR
jgi:hypothetical protein